jgi:membrane protease YdiL (CAAX protease family)
LVPALTAIGIALALLYHRCGSLWPVILAHGAFNAIMVAGLYAGLAAGLEIP